MSLESWKNEFYPVTAIAIASEGNDLDLIKHSILKWEGMRLPNLLEHGLQIDSGSDIEDPATLSHLYIDTDSCALCQRYYDYGSCVQCPIVKVTGKRCTEGEPSPYETWGMDNNPEPMVELLKEVLAEYETSAPHIQDGGVK